MTNRDQDRERPEPGLDADDLLRFSAQWLLRDPDRERFMRHLAQHGADLFSEAVTDDPDAVARAPQRRVLRAEAPQFFRGLAWVVASSMPLPSNDWTPQRGRLPGRNEPCLCGSLRKFKHCCERLMQRTPTLDAGYLASLVVAALPASAWPALAGSRVPPRALAAVASDLAEDGEPERAMRLLQAWGKLPAPWPKERVDLLDLLADLYLELDHPRRRKALAQAMIERGDRDAQSLGWQRVSMMASDAGDARAARAAFERAQRLTPDDPRVALLEVTTLLADGDTARAHDRAAFHARRLQRLPQAAELAHEIQALQAIARGEMDTVAQGGGEFDDGFDDAFGDAEDDEGAALLRSLDAGPFDELAAWVRAQPPVRLRLDLGDATDADLGALKPAAALKRPLAAWRKAFAPESGDDRSHALQALSPGRWMPLLQREPVLLDSFDVLHDLVSGLAVVPFGFAVGLQTALLTRALDLWTALRERFPRALCEWAWLENRPALSLLETRIALDRTPQAESSFGELQAMVNVLNPHDNHGLRQRLGAVLLRRGDAAGALALAERYPSDFVGMQLLHARALLDLQRLDEAGPVLDRALKANGHVLKLLLGRRAPRTPDVPSYAVGSIEEARITLAEQFDLWKDKTVQQWVAGRVTAGDVGQMKLI